MRDQTRSWSELHCWKDDRRGARDTLAAWGLPRFGRADIIISIAGAGLLSFAFGLLSAI